jgi:cysteine-S-conjugate beta-lyase
MTVNFDEIIKRRGTESIKWQRYEKDVIPMWVADMDFQCPDNIQEALHQCVNHGIFGYAAEPSELRQVIVDRLSNRYQWEVSPDSLVFLPGVVNNLNLIYRTFASPPEEVLVSTPAYPPFLHGPKNADLTVREVELISGNGDCFEIDFEAFEAAINKKSRLFVLCNPHNPTGRVFQKKELEKLAQLCLKHNLLICSDDIHCDIVYPGSRYLPIASLDKDIEAATITMISPGKTFNIADLNFSVAIVPNKALRDKLVTIRNGLHIGPNLFASVATEVAYRDCDAWVKKLLIYLESNRNMVYDFVQNRLPGIQMFKPEATFLAWLDCRQSNIRGNPQSFFIEQARVAFNDGTDFGQGGDGFVRLNFGCQKSILEKALNQMEAALQKIS